MKEIKLSFTVNEEVAKKIDKYWHSRRLANRTEALRQLVVQALKYEKFDTLTDLPTQKQINLVNNLCKEKSLQPPKDYTLKAYSKFISENLKKKKE